MITDANAFATFAKEIGATNGLEVFRAVHFSGVARFEKSKCIGIDFVTPYGPAKVDDAVVVRRETAIDRFGKRIGVDREISTGDATFDRACYVESDAPSDLLSALLHPALRDALRRVIEAGVIASVSILPDGNVSIFVAPSSFAHGQRVAAALDDAKRLVDALAEPMMYRDDRMLARGFRAPRTAKKTANRLALPYFFAILGSIPLSAMPLVATLEWSASELAIVAGAQVVHLALLVLLFRGRSDGLRYLARTSLLALFPSLVLSANATTLANSALDGAPRTRVAGSVHSVPSKTGWSNNVTVFDKTVSKSINSTTFYSLPTPATVTVGQGALGARWIENVEIER